MEVTIKGKDKDINKFLKVQKLWMKRNGITIVNGEVAETKPEAQKTQDKEDQIILFDALPNKKVGGEVFELNAESSSELPLTYISSDNEVATIEGNKVTIIKDGKIIITASQIGNDKFKASKVTQELIIKKKAY